MIISNTVSVPPAVLYAQDGQLFGTIDISQSTLGDSDASQIALTSVEYILIKFDSTSTVVYEAQIVTDGADGRTKDAIYVRLTASCVQEMNLVAESTVETEIQFRLNRVHFCDMHWAVDELITTNLLFPSKNEHPALM